MGFSSLDLNETVERCLFSVFSAERRPSSPLLDFTGHYLTLFIFAQFCSILPDIFRLCWKLLKFFERIRLYRILTLST